MKNCHERTLFLYVKHYLTRILILITPVLKPWSPETFYPKIYAKSTTFFPWNHGGSRRPVVTGRPTRLQSRMQMSLVPSILFAVRVYSKRPLWGHQPRRRSRLRPGYALLRVAASSGTGSRLSGSPYKNQDTRVFTLTVKRESFRENCTCEFFNRFNPTLRLEERTVERTLQRSNQFPIYKKRILKTRKISTRNALQMLDDGTVFGLAHA